MRWLCLSLFLLCSIASAREYVGTGGWTGLGEDADAKGKLSIHYTSKEEWWHPPVHSYYLVDDANFALTLDFKNLSDSWARYWLPNPLTVSGSVYLDHYRSLGGQPSKYEYSGLLFAEDEWEWNKIIGWFNCVLEESGQRVCIMRFRGGDNLSGAGWDGKVSLEVRKKFEQGELCYLSGYVYTTDESRLAWHSKRLCD